MIGRNGGEYMMEEREGEYMIGRKGCGIRWGVERKGEYMIGKGGGVCDGKRGGVRREGRGC